MRIKQGAKARMYTAACLGILFFQTSPVGAVQALSAPELAAHCQALPEAKNTSQDQYCIRYIQGFIDGAVATDARVMLKVESARGAETYTERAMRTRAASRNNRQRAASYAGFCLGDPVSLAEVVQKVVSELRKNSPLAADSNARDIVYAALRRHYPCKEEST